MIKFNTDNIVVGEIKEILSSFNLPKAAVLKDETTYIPNKIYIKGDKIYRSSLDGSSIEELKDVTYDWGDKLDNITHTLPVTSNIYDIQTHKYLGNYLRWIRDYRGLNLMSMYNCFSNESPANLNEVFFDKGNIRRQFSSSDVGHKIFMVPVKIGQVYTIGLNTTRPVEMVCGYYAHNKLIKVFPNSFMVKRSCLFDEVFIYSGAEKLNEDTAFEDWMYQEEDNLYMFIKLPISYESSIVILEGDFTKNNNVFINVNGYSEVEYVTSAFNETKTDCFYAETPSRLQLLSCRSNYSYPFADKLLQYLFSNVITKYDEIQNNIKKAQETLMSKGYLPYIRRYGIWTDDVTAACRLCSHKNVNHREVYKDYDVIGYLDSDIENELGGIE